MPKGSSRLPSSLLAACLVGMGCGTWYSGLREPAVEVSREYESALKEHTRSGWRSRGVERLVTVNATIHTQAFLAALAEEQERATFVPPDAAEQPLALPHAGEGVVSFMVHLEALEPAWERLDRADPVWVVLLEVDGKLHQPSRVRAMDWRDPMLRRLYPYVTRFGRPWLVTFEVDEIGAAPVLWVTGAPARLRLDFQLP